MFLALKWLELHMIASEIEMLARKRAMGGANVHASHVGYLVVEDPYLSVITLIHFRNQSQKISERMGSMRTQK